MSSNTRPVTAVVNDDEAQVWLEPNFTKDQETHHHYHPFLKHLQSPISNQLPSRTLSMNNNKQRQPPVAVPTNKKEEVLCWHRTTTSKNIPPSFSEDSSPSKSVPSSGVIKAFSRRKKSSSMNRKIAQQCKGGDFRKTSSDTPTLHDSDASLGDFSKQNEIFSHRKNSEQPQSFHSSNLLSSATRSSCNLNDMDGQSAKGTNPLANISFNSTSLNSENGDSMVSSTSSISTDKLPLPKTPRRTHAARTIELRKQVREVQRMEQHLNAANTSPKKQRLFPRIMVPVTAGHVAKHPPTKTKSESQMLSNRESSPIQRTRSLQRKHSLDHLPMKEKDDADSSSWNHSQPPKRISSRGSAMKNILRNRRKLERELSRNDIFKYVLHKRPIDQHPMQLDSARSFDTGTNTSSTSHSLELQHRTILSRHSAGLPNSTSSASTLSTGKMPLEQFLKMKQQSEMIVQIQQQHDKKLKPRPIVCNQNGQPLSHHKPQEVEETWHESHSLDNFLSNHGSSSDLKMNDGHPFGMVRPILGQALFRLDRQKKIEQQDGSVVDAEVFILDDNKAKKSKLTDVSTEEESHDSLDSFISDDGKDLPSAWEDCVCSEDKKTNATIRERKRSQGLTLLMDDAQLLVDDDHVDDTRSLQDSMDSLSLIQDVSIATEDMIQKHVTDFVLTDLSSGRRGFYSGPISTVTHLPHGDGRLEFSDRGEVFLGRFLHGWWSGYGTYINDRTKEQYTGYFLDYVRHGQGVTNFSDGRVFEGRYRNGSIANGKMTYQDRSVYIGSFDNDARSGRGSYFFTNEVVFTGKFRSDQFLSGTLLYPNGHQFRGHWNNGVRNGPGTELHSDGSVIREGMWQDGCFVP
ncbi:MORN repeat-containing protein [Nitzschia inconspicua]|uniref:MORN repeat-containing protein n=1 Tax=Nitzschia inconspicua TaxID=303405 RepID=A0A9K3Q6Z8_9STRA|nr:MORN repeat-containing protein [Nitzschia inconspicua]